MNQLVRFITSLLGRPARTKSSRNVHDRWPSSVFECRSLRRQCSSGTWRDHDFISYSENQVPATHRFDATVQDVDSPNLIHGKLDVMIICNPDTSDRIGIMNVGTGAGQIGVSGNTVSFGGVAIGSFTASRSLTVNFNSAATRLRLQALLRGSRSLRSATRHRHLIVGTIYITDGDGGTSNMPTKVVKVTAVNDACTGTYWYW